MPLHLVVDRDSAERSSIVKVALQHVKLQLSNLETTNRPSEIYTHIHVCAHICSYGCVGGRKRSERLPFQSNVLLDNLLFNHEM